MSIGDRRLWKTAKRTSTNLTHKKKCCSKLASSFRQIDLLSSRLPA